MEAHPRTWIGVSVDIKNAFSSVDHKAVETALVTRWQHEAGFGADVQCYSTPISAYSPAARTTPYGSPEDGRKTGRHARVWNVKGLIFFCAALHSPIDEATRAADAEYPTTTGDCFRNGLAPVYADDIHMYGTPEWIDVF
jgi:hypothetical protein